MCASELCPILRISVCCRAAMSLKIRQKVCSFYVESFESNRLKSALKDFKGTYVKKSGIKSKMK